MTSPSNAALLWSLCLSNRWTVHSGFHFDNFNKIPEPQGVGKEQGKSCLDWNRVLHTQCVRLRMNCRQHPWLFLHMTNGLWTVCLMNPYATPKAWILNMTRYRDICWFWSKAGTEITLDLCRCKTFSFFQTSVLTVTDFWSVLKSHKG